MYCLYTDTETEQRILISLPYHLVELKNCLIKPTKCRGYLTHTHTHANMHTYNTCIHGGHYLENSTLYENMFNSLMAAPII